MFGEKKKQEYHDELRKKLDGNLLVLHQINGNLEKLFNEISVQNEKNHRDILIKFEELKKLINSNINTSSNKFY